MYTVALKVPARHSFFWLRKKPITNLKSMFKNAIIQFEGNEVWSP